MCGPSKPQKKIRTQIVLHVFAFSRIFSSGRSWGRLWTPKRFQNRPQERPKSDPERSSKYMQLRRAIYICIQLGANLAPTSGQVEAQNRLKIDLEGFENRS